MSKNSGIYLFHLLFLAWLAAAGLTATTSTAHAETLHVGGSNPSNYSSVQAALDDADPGDTVFVHAGMYYENIILTDGVSLEGEGADVTKLIGQETFGAPSIAVRVLNIGNAAISGFTIGFRSSPAGSFGLYIYQSSNINIGRNIIRNAETGAYVDASSGGFHNNVFYPDNQEISGILIQNSSAVIKNNIIMNYGTGISVTGRAVQVSYNDLFQCGVNYSGIEAGSGAISADPLFTAQEQGDFYLRETSPCVDAGDPADSVPAQGGTRIDMGAFEYQYPPPLPEIVEGPQASVISDTEAQIVWQTSIPCGSMVKYGMTADSFDQQAGDSTLAVIHSIALTGLIPATTYQYFARSVDEAGNAVESESDYFTTQAGPDFEPPSLEVSVPKIITQPVTVHTVAYDNIGIEKVEFWVDDELQYTLFGNTCDWILDPAGLTNGNHILKVAARDKAGAETIQRVTVEVAIQPLDVSPPQRGIISPAEGSNVSGGSVTIEAWGLDPESGIDSFIFYVDNQLMHVAQINGEAGVDEHASWQWNSYGFESREDHEIRVVILNNTGLSASEQFSVHVINMGSILDEMEGPSLYKYFFIKLIRGQVKRDGIYYKAKLYVQNLSPNKIYDVTVCDTHAGFQAIQNDYGHKPRVRFDPDTFSSKVTYNIGRLMPGEIKECTIDMSTVLVSPDPLHFNYEIGNLTQITYKREEGPESPTYSLTYHVPAVKTIEGWWGTDEIPLNVQTILAPVSSRNYLVVTHPRKLYSLYNAAEVDNLLSELAIFVRHKNAVLGYLNTPAPRTELLNMTGHKNAIPISGALFPGDWSKLLHPFWLYNGYMLLVGETEILPSFSIIVTIPAGQYTVPLTDQPYADLNDDGFTDLILGRIIGNDAEALSTPIITSRGVQQDLTGYDFDASHALLISGMGNYESSFVNNINNISDVMDNKYAPSLPNLKLHRTEYSSPQSAWAAFQLLFPHRDIVYFDGHGGPNGWGNSVLVSGDVDDLYFSVNPVVISLSCHTGEYEKENDISIAETFLEHGAGLYIGATRMSNTGTNARNGLLFFNHFWRPWLGIGYAWRNLERDIWTNPGYWRFSLAYNIYGDPKFGVGGTESLIARASSKAATAGAPPNETTLDLPDYTVTTSDGIDHVEIPNGDTLVDPGQYQVPFWIEEIDIPHGYVVQDVDLLERSGLNTSQGLHLPVSPDDFMENDAGEPYIPAEYLWYPDVPFRWAVIPGSDSEDAGSTLTIMVYPFLYNTETTESKYYTHYEFGFSITESSVTITAAEVEKKAVLPGQPVNMLLELYNQENQGKIVRLRTVIEPYAGKLHIDGLPIHTMELSPGHSALTESWDSTGIPDGHYRLKVIAEDEEGNLLDTANDHFTIGSDSADICYGDSEADGDVDGTDLAVFLEKDDLSRINEFAATYGWACQ